MFSVHIAKSQNVTIYPGNLDHIVTSMAAPGTIDWSGCRAGFALTEKRRLSMARAKSCRSPDTENPADAVFLIGNNRPLSDL